MRAKVVRWGRFWCKILEKIFSTKKMCLFSRGPSTDDRRPTKYARMVARQRRRRRAWNDGARKTPKSPPPRVVATRPRQQRQQRQQRAIAMRLCGRYFWCSQNQCVSSSSFRSLLLESFSLRFVDVRLCTRDATWSIFVGVTKLFLFVVFALCFLSRFLSALLTYVFTLVSFFCLLLVVNTSSLWSSTPLVSLLRRFFVFVVLVFFRAVVFSSSSSSSSSFSSRSRAPPVVVAVVSSRRIVVFFSMCFRFGMAVATAPPSTRRTIIGVNDFLNSSNSFVSLTSKTQFAETCFDFVASSCSRASSAFRWASATFAAWPDLCPAPFVIEMQKKTDLWRRRSKRERRL